MEDIQPVLSSILEQTVGRPSERTSIRLHLHGYLHSEAFTRLHHALTSLKQEWQIIKITNEVKEFEPEESVIEDDPLIGKIKQAVDIDLSISPNMKRHVIDLVKLNYGGVVTFQKIEKLVIEDCRIWKGRHEFDFENGVNVIHGDNGVGKSTLAMMLMLTMTHGANAPELRKQLLPTTGGSPKSGNFTTQDGHFTIRKVWGDRTQSQLVDVKRQCACLRR